MSMLGIELRENFVSCGADFGAIASQSLATASSALGAKRARQLLEFG